MNPAAKFKLDDGVYIICLAFNCKICRRAVAICKNLINRCSNGVAPLNGTLGNPTGAAEQPGKPSYRFSGEKLPSALAPLRKAFRWLAWDYRLKRDKWAKLPFCSRTGGLASVNDPKTWATFDEALAGMKRYRFGRCRPDPHG